MSSDHGLHDIHFGSFSGEAADPTNVPDPPASDGRATPAISAPPSADAPAASAAQLGEILKTEPSLHPANSGSLASLRSLSPAYTNPGSSGLNSLAGSFVPQGAAALFGAYPLSPDLVLGDGATGSTSDIHSQLASNHAFYMKNAAQQLGLSANTNSLFYHQHLQQQQMQQEQAWLGQYTLSGLPGAGSFGQGELPGLCPANMQPDLDALSMCALANALPDWATQPPGSRAPLTQINPWQATIPVRSAEPQLPA